MPAADVIQMCRMNAAKKPPNRLRVCVLMETHCVQYLDESNCQLPADVVPLLPVLRLLLLLLFTDVPFPPPQLGSAVHARSGSNV